MEVLKYRVDGTSEWKDLVALQGEPGKNGLDGYTPVRGKDYWTNEDVLAIKEHCNSYIDSQLAIINERLTSLTEKEIENEE